MTFSAHSFFFFFLKLYYVNVFNYLRVHEVGIRGLGWLERLSNMTETLALYRTDGCGGMRLFIGCVGAD